MLTPPFTTRDHKRGTAASTFSPINTSVKSTTLNEACEASKEYHVGSEPAKACEVGHSESTTGVNNPEGCDDTETESNGNVDRPATILRPDNPGKGVSGVVTERTNTVRKTKDDKLSNTGERRTRNI